MLLLGDIVIEVTGPLLSPAKVLVVTDVAIDDECGCGGRLQVVKKKMDPPKSSCMKARSM